MQELILTDSSHQLFVFKEIFNFTAAREQAEKKKLNAFGLLAKFNFLKRPTEESVILQQEIHRYEPFWMIKAKRSTEYTYNATYNIPIHNPHAQNIQVSDTNINPVIRTIDRAKFDLSVIEHCHRTIEYTDYLDGLNRDIKPSVLLNYIQRYPTEEKDTTTLKNVIQPQLSQTTVLQKINAYMNTQILNTSDISKDTIEIDSIHLYFRPVFAFEYRWATTDKIGVIEIDGLTGEIIENGNWFKDTFDQAITRNTLIDISADLASTVIPGGGAIIKVANHVISK